MPSVTRTDSHLSDLAQTQACPAPETTSSFAVQELGGEVSMSVEETNRCLLWLTVCSISPVDLAESCRWCCA